jgi:subtilisin
MDAVAAKYIENFGVALVIVNPQDISADADNSKKVEENFLSKVPEGAATTTTAVARHRRKKREAKPYKYYRKLGLYVGYMDAEGIKKTEQAGARVNGTEYFSLIRPVSKKLATAAGQLTWGLKRLAADRLWSNGLNGKGVKVGHLDTGVDGKHNTLRGRLKEFIETDASGEIVPDSRPPSKKAHDSNDHGTHTAGTICGSEVNGMAIGMAPKCELYSAMVIEGGQVVVRVLTGLEWCLENNVRILSMSLGFRGFTPVFRDVIQRLRENGTLPVIAIGNERKGTSRSPGNYPEPISVGAVNNRMRVPDFSSSIIFQRSEEPFQPNVVAPGVDVISAKPGGGVQSMDGTSMATPHMAGVAAILFGAEPEASVDQVEEAILTTCKPLVKDEKERYGFGFVQPEAALAKLRKLIM